MMFGSVCSGRPVQLAEQVDTNKYVINILNGQKISHVALFLLPNVELDPSFVALVYFQLPNQEFKLLGSISSTKPSAIFKLNNSVQNTAQINDDVEMDTDGNTNNDPTNNISIGISIEPAAEAEAQLQQSKLQAKASKPKQIAATPYISSISPSDPTSTALLANKIVKHAYNYMTGFIDSEGRVNIKIFDNWWDKFKTRLQNDPKFLDSQD